MKTILFFDQVRPAARPHRLILPDTVASAFVRAGVAAAADPADAGALGAGAVLDPGAPTQIVLEHGLPGLSRMSRYTVPLAVAQVAIGAGAAASVTGAVAISVTMIAGSHSGTTIVALPSNGAVSPNDGRVLVAGDDTNGYRLVVGLTASSPGTVNYTVAGTVYAITTVAAVAPDLSGHYFASTRFRTPIALAAVAAGSESRVDVSESYSPAYACNNFRVAFPGHYRSTSGTLGCSPMPNPYSVEGATLWAFISGAWVQQPILVAGQANFTVQPGVGLLSDEVIFPGNVPPNTRTEVRIPSSVASGGSMISNYIPSQASGRVEWAVVGATSQVAQAGVATKPTGTDGRMAGTIFCPSFIVAKPVAPLDRPVYLVTHDSKGYGKNENETYLATPFLSAGFIARALDDTARRMSGYLMGAPSNGIAEYLGSKSDLEMGLIRLCPNRPYTRIWDDHYNNSNALVTGYRATFSSWFGQLLKESTYWGNAPVPLDKSRVIPRSNSWSTQLAGAASVGGQDGADSLASSIRWQLDADLVAGNVFSELTGVIPTNTYYAYDQSGNRDKVKLGARSYTLAAAYVSGASTASVVELPVIDDRIVMDATKSNGGLYIRSFTGTGPYTVTFATTVATGVPSGTLVPTTNVGDSVGLHPGATGMASIAQAPIEWKAANL